MKISNKEINKDIRKFIKIAEIRKQDIILNIPFGDIAVAKRLSKKKKISLHILEEEKFQVKNAKKFIKKAEFYISSSVLKTPFKNDFFDKIFIRNGIYQILKNKQLILFKEIYRILKTKGKFINWTIALNNKNKKFFNKLSSKKNEISGFSKNIFQKKYFASKEEIISWLKKAGFRKIKIYDLKIFYLLSTDIWFKIDFKKDLIKSKEWNNYIKSLIFKYEISDIQIKYIKNNFQLKIPALISIAEK
ncbi:MAG: methyltransferase domain-containing protein [Candidatus Pacearchaeota archaeon]